MKIFRNLKLQYKMLILAIIPVLVMGIVAILISNTVVKNKLLDDAKQKLKATSNAVLAAYDQNAGDYFVNATGDVWKGAYNVSLSTPFIDDIAAKTGIEVTFFYNDTRLVTSLKDADGKRILGSKAGDFLVENVLQDGNEVFTNRVLVDGTFYFGYYVPVHQNNSDEIIGTVFAGMPVKEITDMMTKKSGLLAVSEISGDCRDIVKAEAEGNHKAHVAREMLLRSVRRFIGAYAAELGHVDAMVFTAGIGENDIELREKVCDNLGFMGVKIDKEKNNCRGKEVEITAPGASIRTFIIPTNEELMIAKDTQALVEAM